MLTPINQKLFELLEYDLKDKRFTKDLSIIDKEQRSKTTNIDIDINGLNESLSIAINKKFETLTEEKKLYGYLSEEKKLQSIINKINEKPFVELEQERKTFEEKLEKVTGHQEKIKQEKGTVVYTSDQTFNTETYQNEKLILSRINVAENNRLIGNINDSILAAETRVNILREESRKLKNHLSQKLEVIEQKIKELKPMLPPTPKEEERRKSWEMNNNVVIVQLEKLEKEKTVIESQIKTIDVATSRTVPIAQVEFSKDLPKKEDIPKEQPSQIVKESVPLHRADSEKVQPSIPVPPPMPRDPLWQRQETQKSEKAPHPIEPNVIIQEQPSQKRENGPRPRAASDPGESRTDVPDSGKKTQDTPERDKKEEPDKSTKDALHTAIGENLKARQELLQVTIEKQREILGIIPKKAKHLPELNAIDKKTQENEAELAKLKTQLDDPKTWKPEMIQLPKGQSATVENIKAEINKQNPNLGNIVEQARKNAESMRNSSVQKSPHQVR